MIIWMEWAWHAGGFICSMFWFLNAHFILPAGMSKSFIHEKLVASIIFFYDDFFVLLFVCLLLPLQQAIINEIIHLGAIERERGENKL